MAMFTMLQNIVHNLFNVPATRPYPVFKRQPIPGSRGQLIIDPEACSYCTVCEKRCPANAIFVTRKPQTITLDPYRCIVCAYCVEVCPKNALSMDAAHRTP